MNVVKSFSTCPALKQLSVHDLWGGRASAKMNSVQDFCNCWSRKSSILFVLLFGIEYLPYKVKTGRAVVKDGTYLESLSLDVIRNVFRWFGDTPHAKDWNSGLRFEDLHHLYLGEGALSESCRPLFPVISNLNRFHMVIGGKMQNQLQVLIPEKTWRQCFELADPSLRESICPRLTQHTARSGL